MMCGEWGEKWRLENRSELVDRQTKSVPAVAVDIEWVRLAVTPFT